MIPPKSIILLPQPHLKVLIGRRLLATCDHALNWSLHASGALMLATVQLDGSLHVATDRVQLIVT